MPALSIVMPAHNEGTQIEAAVDDWLREVTPTVPDVEIIVVDDCSTDDTGAKLAALAARAPQVRVLRTPTNVGHGGAVRLGLSNALGAHVFQTDSDRQHAPADLWSLWNLRYEAPFVFGVRVERADGTVRKVISTALRLINRVAWGASIRDANCPFKLMERQALSVVLADIPTDSFIPMVMVALLARYRGYPVREVPVRHFPRTAGQHSLRGLTRWLRVGRLCTAQLIALRRSVRGNAVALRADAERSRR